MAKAQKVATRILGDITVEGKSYKTNQVVAFPAKLTDSLEKNGQVDSNPDAAGYAFSTHGEVIEHDAAEAEDAAETPAT